MLETMEIIDGKKCYFCALITDWEIYKEIAHLLEAGEPLIGMKYIECRQPIEIFEDGRVHIVH